MLLNEVQFCVCVTVFNVAVLTAALCLSVLVMISAAYGECVTPSVVVVLP